MNKTALLLFFFMCMNWVTQAQKYTEIRGVVKNDRLREVKMFRIEDGTIKLHTTTSVANDGSYGFLLYPEYSGFYMLGDDRTNFPVYVKGGEHIEINLLEHEAVLSGKNTRENEMLYRWEEFSSSIRLKSLYFWKYISTYKEFFPELEVFVTKVDSVKRKLKTGNREFDALMKRKIDYDVDYYAMNFAQSPKTVHPKLEDYPAFYRTIISNNKFRTDEVMGFAYGAIFLSHYTSLTRKFLGKQYTSRREFLNGSLSCFDNERLKGEFLLREVLARLKTYGDYLEVMREFGQHIVTPSQQKRVEEIGASLYKVISGNIAADFTYPDVNGHKVSLSDFKGNVVLVDVWATWCGPCRQEIPHLKKLEEEMSEKGVVFIGVSLDEAKDKQKWLDFIAKEKLGGIQLHASGWSKVTKDYKIKGIPRFMVIDKQGNLVTENGPRPSSPELKKMLMSELEK